MIDVEKAVLRDLKDKKCIKEEYLNIVKIILSLQFIFEMI